MRSTFIRHLLIQLLSKTENVATINPKPSENLIHSLPSNPLFALSSKLQNAKQSLERWSRYDQFPLWKGSQSRDISAGKETNLNPVSPRLIKKPPRVLGFSPTILDSLLGLLKFADARHDTTLSRRWLNRRNKRKRKRKRKQRAKKTSRNEFLVV